MRDGSFRTPSSKRNIVDEVCHCLYYTSFLLPRVESSMLLPGAVIFLPYECLNVVQLKQVQSDVDKLNARKAQLQVCTATFYS